MAVTRSFCTQAAAVWAHSLKLANERLAKQNIRVQIASHLPLSPFYRSRNYQLLEIDNGKKKQPIDIFKFTSDPLETAGRLVRKAMQHLDAVNTSGIYISPLGRKLDVRKLPPDYRFQMEKDGSLSIKGQRIGLEFRSCCAQKEDQNPFTSESMGRAIQNDHHGGIEIFDDEVAHGEPTESDPFPILYLPEIEKPALKIILPETLDIDRRRFYRDLLKKAKP